MFDFGGTYALRYGVHLTPCGRSRQSPQTAAGYSEST